MAVCSPLSTPLRLSTKTRRRSEFSATKVKNSNLTISTFNQLLAIGVVLVAEKKETSKLFVPLRESGKLYKMDDHIMVAASGIIADANYLIGEGRQYAQQNLYSMHTPVLVEELVKEVANRKHYLTQIGSGRPFGVSFMYAGFDRVRGFQLYNSDPSGNYAAWNAHSTGTNSVTTISSLKEEYKKDVSLKEAMTLGLKLLIKSMDISRPNAEKFEVGVLHRDAQGAVVQRNVEGAELE